MPDFSRIHNWPDAPPPPELPEGVAIMPAPTLRQQLEDSLEDQSGGLGRSVALLDRDLASQQIAEPCDHIAIDRRTGRCVICGATPSPNGASPAAGAGTAAASTLPPANVSPSSVTAPTGGDTAPATSTVTSVPSPTLPFDVQGVPHSSYTLPDWEAIEQLGDAAVLPEIPLWRSILGTAGTGKTFQVRRESEYYPNVKLLATTGIAAVNLGGTTINSLLQYYDTADLQKAYELAKLHTFLARAADSGYTRFLIDEVSMMDGNQLDILTMALDEMNERRLDKDMDTLGLTLVGDFAQLPPVDAPFVFERPGWSRFNEHQVILTEPRRQADPAFVHALQAVRRGDRPAALAYFASKVRNTMIPEFDGSTILSKNDEVDRHNKMRMLKLPGKEVYFDAERWGEQDTAWKNIPNRLDLKVGALVMILANRREDTPGIAPHERSMLYANGDLGHITDVQEMDLPATKSADGTFLPARKLWTPLVTLKRNDRTYPVQWVTREKTKITGARGERRNREDVLGRITYMPLRVAYATTVHKSQGLSLDNVQIMFHSRFFASPGMMYVALSRCKTAEGLVLVGTEKQFADRITVNLKVKNAGFL